MLVVFALEPFIVPEIWVGGWAWWSKYLEMESGYLVGVHISRYGDNGPDGSGQVGFARSSGSYRRRSPLLLVEVPFHKRNHHDATLIYLVMACRIFFFLP